MNQFTRYVFVAASLAFGCLLFERPAEASFCGVARACNSGCGCNCSPTAKTVVMKMCSEVIMAEVESQTFEMKYETYNDKKLVKVIKYVSEPVKHCAPAVIYQPAPVESTPCASCASGNVASSGCASGNCNRSCDVPKMQQLVPVHVCQQFTTEGFRAVESEETVEVPRIVATLVPHPVTLCVPTVVWKLVPVVVCCPQVDCCN